MAKFGMVDEQTKRRVYIPAGAKNINP